MKFIYIIFIYLHVYKQTDSTNNCEKVRIGPLHDPVTWYKIIHAGEQVAEQDFLNSTTCTSPMGPAFVLEVPPHNLLTSMCDFVPCDQIVQRAY